MVGTAMWGISVSEAAERLGVGVQTIRRMFNRPEGEPGGRVTGAWYDTPSGRRERRIDPESVHTERARRADVARAAAQPPNRTGGE